MAAFAALRGVCRRYGDVTALAGFDLELERGELVTVLGPSGCGKSTLLRCIAGLEPLSEGEILLDGRRIDQLPPHVRDVAMVFQSYALYPHMSVFANVEFPLRMARVPAAERRRSVEEIADVLEIGSLLERRPAQLSGGQRQRVALARALVRRPALFLLDEPLSSLDAPLRTSVRRSIRELQRRLGVTTLYVTHDQTEAMTLGDRMVVLEDGRTHQIGTPHEVWTRPADAFVAGFLGTPAMNLLEALWSGGELCVEGQRLAPPPGLGAALGERGSLWVGVRPEAFAPARDAGDGALVAEVEPASCELLGAERLVRARVGSARITVRLAGDGSLPARVSAPTASLHLFSGTDGRRIAP
jgi:ABC-type sugar transport system ATPase subunit